MSKTTTPNCNEELSSVILQLINEMKELKKEMADLKEEVHKSNELQQSRQLYNQNMLSALLNQPQMNVADTVQENSHETQSVQTELVPEPEQKKPVETKPTVEVKEKVEQNNENKTTNEVKEIPTQSKSEPQQKKQEVEQKKPEPVQKVAPVTKQPAPQPESTAIKPSDVVIKGIQDRINKTVKRCIYDSNKDTTNAAKFFNCIHGRKSVVIFVQTDNGIIGSYHGELPREQMVGLDNGDKKLFMFEEKGGKLNAYKPKDYMNAVCSFYGEKSSTMFWLCYGYTLKVNSTYEIYPTLKQNYVNAKEAFSTNAGKFTSVTVWTCE